MKFNTTDSELKKYNGTDVEILRELTNEECDIAEVGVMYKVKFYDGYVRDVFADEILAHPTEKGGDTLDNIQTNFDRLKTATVDEFAKWLTLLQKEVQKQAYDAITEELKDYIIKPDESQIEEWENITFNFYKDWLNSEVDDG